MFTLTSKGKVARNNLLLNLTTYFIAIYNDCKLGETTPDAIVLIFKIGFYINLIYNLVVMITQTKEK